MPRTLFTLTVGLLALCSITTGGLAWANPAYWSSGEWPKTDFTKHSIEFTEIISGGPPKDGIPPIDDPVFQSVTEAAKALSASRAGHRARHQWQSESLCALSVLIWHEIVK